MKLTGKNLGKWGEEQAEKFLVGKGVVILARNIQTKYGEIDLLALDEKCLIFIEVKTSQTRKYGFAEVSVNARKIDHMKKAAQKYIQDHEEISSDWRIDVLSIDIDFQNKTEINWFKNAVTEL